MLLAGRISHTAGVQLMLTIDVFEEPLRGEIVAHGGMPVSFVGWLGLLSCLSDLVESSRGEVVASGPGGDLDPGARGRRQPRLELMGRD